MPLSKKRRQLLLVEDSPTNALVYKTFCQDDFDVVSCFLGQDALDVSHQQTFDIILLDVQLPDMTGLDVLADLRQRNINAPVIVITAHGSVDIAVEAMRLGANDFLSKPFDKARLLITIRNVIKGCQLSQIVDQYERSCQRQQLHRMLGASLSMQSVFNIIESAASSRATVFITGESGTGKELCAEAIHKQSLRAKANFVSINCAAIPRDLLESEIFGHVKGAFTGAVSSREGAAARADGGTLFLDEIGELPLDLQSKLLRFVQEGTYQPVGSNKEIQVDVRFVCATNREPLKEVKEGRFREDLYYRLHVIPIHMPALRDRGQDSLLIAKRLLTEFSLDEQKHFQGFDKVVEQVILHYPWPGNVRELGNVIRNVVVLNDGQWVTRQMLPAPLDRFEPAHIDHKPLAAADPLLANLQNPDQQGSDDGINAAEASLVQPMQGAANSPATEVDATVFPFMPRSEKEIVPLWQQEKMIIEHAIALCNDNIPKAAAFLEISASTIYRKKTNWEQMSQ